MYPGHGYISRQSLVFFSDVIPQHYSSTKYFGLQASRLAISTHARLSPYICSNLHEFPAIFTNTQQSPHICSNLHTSPRIASNPHTSPAISTNRQQSPHISTNLHESSAISTNLQVLFGSAETLETDEDWRAARRVAARHTGLQPSPLRVAALAT